MSIRGSHSISRIKIFESAGNSHRRISEKKIRSPGEEQRTVRRARTAQPGQTVVFLSLNLAPKGRNQTRFPAAYRAGGSGTRIVTKTQNAVHVMQGASAGKNR
jgi:hypothetical protein